MKTKMVYMLVPVVALAGFGWAYWLWSAEQSDAAATAQASALKARNEAKEDLYGGKAYAARDGEKEALADIAKGSPKYYVYGLPARSESAMAEIMHSRFGIEWTRIAGCMVSDPLVRFADTYDKEVESYIARRFGPNAFVQAEKDAAPDHPSQTEG
ncbi:MAG: hypothetical protein JSS11_07530 [Verrucomicrobia bacterium]|nr:hypothetical protein [Verrucomicrobiota bacterium]